MTSIQHSGSIGEDIHTSIRYVAKTLVDVHSMLELAEVQLDEQGWSPLRRSEIVHTLSNSINQPEYWLASVIARGYGKFSDPKALDPLEEFRVIEVHLSPEFSAQAMVVIGKARLKTPSDRKEIWSSWLNYIGSLLSRNNPLNELFTVEGGIAANVITLATNIAMRTFPLVDIPDRSAVTNRIVSPLLAL